MKLRVGLLGMSDNLSTRVILAELARLGRPLDVVFLQHAGVRGQWRRVLRKLRSAGLCATLQRIVFAASSRLLPSLADGTGSVPWSAAVHHRVGEVNAVETRRLIRNEDLDLLLIVTDSLLGRGTFTIPRIGTLNAHPGWVPAYRGLGSIARMLRDGFAPAISVHIIDEGVDTGPAIMREHVDRRIALGGIEGELACYREQARLFAKAIALFESGRAVPIDTFLEPSSMARGLTAADTRRIYASVRERISELAPLPHAPTKGAPAIVRLANAPSADGRGNDAGAQRRLQGKASLQGC